MRFWNILKKEVTFSCLCLELIRKEKEFGTPALFHIQIELAAPVSIARGNFKNKKRQNGARWRVPLKKILIKSWTMRFNNTRGGWWRWAGSPPSEKRRPALLLSDRLPARSGDVVQIVNCMDNKMAGFWIGFTKLTNYLIRFRSLKEKYQYSEILWQYSVGS